MLPAIQKHIDFCLIGGIMNTKWMFEALNFLSKINVLILEQMDVTSFTTKVY